MNNKKLMLTFMVILISLVLLMNKNFSLNSLIIIWLSILLFLMSKGKNHFITLLLILEMMSMTSIFMMSLLSQNMNSVMLMFILMTLSVGEAVLGLAILVKLVRWASTEFIMSGLN